MLCEGATEEMCNMTAAYVLASAYRKLLCARPEALRKGHPGKACAGDWATCVVLSCRATKTCLKNDPLPPEYAPSPLARSQHVCEEAWFDSMADRCPACREEKK